MANSFRSPPVSHGCYAGGAAIGHVEQPAYFGGLSVRRWPHRTCLPGGALLGRKRRLWLPVLRPARLCWKLLVLHETSRVLVAPTFRPFDK
jgi:hypothetical protein